MIMAELFPLHCNFFKVQWKLLWLRGLALACLANGAGLNPTCGRLNYSCGKLGFIIHSLSLLPFHWFHMTKVACHYWCYDHCSKSPVQLYHVYDFCPLNYGKC